MNNNNKQNQIIYNVTVNIQSEIENEWLTWMQNIHIPEVLETKCFLKASLLKIAESQIQETTYAVQYIAKDYQQYEKYINEFSQKLREKTLQKYGDKVLAFRTILEIVNIWEA